MATIKPRKDKDGNTVSYKVTLCVGRDDQYRQVWRTCTIKRPEGLTPAKERKEVQRQADAWEQKQKAEFDRTHEKHDKTKITFKEFVENHWMPDHVRTADHTPSTIEFFEYTAGMAIDFFGERKRLKEINTEAIKRYLNFLRTTPTKTTGQPFGASSVKHFYGTLKNILRYARRMHYIDYDPTEDLSQQEKPHRQKKTVDFLEREQAVRFLACLEAEPLFWQALYNILITCGLRRGEVAGLQWGDLNTQKLELSISRNVTHDKAAGNGLHIGKTKTGEARTVPISDRLCRLLLSLKEEQQEKFGALLMPSAFIFSNDTDPYRPIRPDSITQHLRRFVQRNRLPNMSPHDLRHTAATLALEAGADLKDVQTLLGHADPSTTLKFYAGVSEEKQRRTVEGIERLLTKQA